jgi:hypothetical protein
VIVAQPHSVTLIVLNTDLVFLLEFVSVKIIGKELHVQIQFV